MTCFKRQRINKDIGKNGICCNKNKGVSCKVYYVELINNRWKACGHLDEGVVGGGPEIEIDALTRKIIKIVLTE